MLVYVISESAEFQKVGISQEISARLSQLQGGNPRTLSVAFTLHTDRARAVEQYAHWMLRSRHAGGEWFKVSAKLAIRVVEAAHRSVIGGNRVSFTPKRRNGSGWEGPGPQSSGTLWDIGSSTAADGQARRRILDNAYRLMVAPRRNVS